MCDFTKIGYAFFYRDENWVNWSSKLKFDKSPLRSYTFFWKIVIFWILLIFAIILKFPGDQWELFLSVLPKNILTLLSILYKPQNCLMNWCKCLSKMIVQYVIFVYIVACIVCTLLKSYGLNWNKFIVIKEHLWLWHKFSLKSPEFREQGQPSDKWFITLKSSLQFMKKEDFTLSLKHQLYKCTYSWL